MEQNLSLYKIFYTVATTENISRAAQILYISQPAISKAIHKLETNLDVVLFRRSSRGVTLTREGTLLYQHIKTAFQEIDAGEQLLLKNKTLGISQLRIGVSTTLCRYLLLPYLKLFVEQYPHVKITISCQSTQETLSLLDERKVDIGLTWQPKGIRSYYFQPLKTIQDTFVASPSYLENLALRSDVKDPFSNATFMMLNEENLTRQYVNDHMKDHALEFHNILEVSTMDLLIEFAKIGLGIACVAKEFILSDLADGSLREISTGVHFPLRQISFVCKKDDIAIPVIRNFFQLLMHSPLH